MPTEPTYYRTPDPAAQPADDDEFPGFENVFESRGEAVPADADPEAAGLSRRKFLTLAALGVASAAGCRRPDIAILPFASTPDEHIGHAVPGKPTFYATALPRPGGALPILVESHDGRPTKIEGNPQHPCSLGSTDAHAQASIYDLYSPDRVMSDRFPGVMEGGAPRKWEDFDRFVRAKGDELACAKGKGFYILMEQTTSPAVRLLRDAMKEKFPEASWHTYEATDLTEEIELGKAHLNGAFVQRYRFDRAERVLALDSDFLGGDGDSVTYQRAFAMRRAAGGKSGEFLKQMKGLGWDIGDEPTETNRLYVVESTYTVTGTMADHRLRLPAMQIGEYLLALARELQASHGGKLKRNPIVPTQEPTREFESKWVKAVAKDLAEHAGKFLVTVGPRQPQWVRALAHMVNDALGNYAAGMAEFRDAPRELLDGTLKGLTDAMAAGKVSTLLVVGGNPVFNAPADLNFAAELAKVPTKLRLGLFHDHTSEKCDWHLPLAHPLESWGDTEAADGSLCCIQPLIAPLNSGRTSAEDLSPPARGGRSLLEVLALMAQVPGPDGKPVGSYFAAQKAAYALVRKSFSDRSGVALDDAAFETAFNRYKQCGFLPVDVERAKALGFAAPDAKARQPKPVTIANANVRIVTESIPAQPDVEVTFRPSYSVGDGRFAMNSWLQELPDPITKLVWDNAAVISPNTATAFGIAHNDVVELSISGRAITIPAFVLPGQADGSVALAFGQFGDMRIAHVPQGGGTNVYPLRTTGQMHIARGTPKKVRGKGDLVTTQEHGFIPEGRDIVRETTHGAHKHGHEPHKSDDHGPKIGVGPDGHITEEMPKKQVQGGYGNPQHPRGPAKEKQERFPLDLARPELLDSQFQWGMVIDLNACTGCSACMVACQAENNIPVVGKHEIARNRELHWIRLDRYFTGPVEEPRIVSQPVACVQCEAAPCEQVCPVNAAVHSPDGLNLQVYNRCIGTRYCANACPYKVRRFNWFDFNKRRLDELRVPTPFASGGTSFTDTGVPESLKMQKNPDVTVRMRGVMEKCTYCVQRIERGKYGAKIAATEVAQGRRVIDIEATFKPAEGTIYKKPKNPRAADYDLDAQGRVTVPDGVIVPACESACPSRAITFGNTLDANSRVSKLKALEGDYMLLGELNTKPRTSYLPRVRNLNPDMG
jgi:molybdopterin-containing oxidoreductase family iron-sulfur binding subunit